MDQDKKEMPREITHDELENDQAYAAELRRIAGSEQVAKDFDEIVNLVLRFEKTAKHAKTELEQSTKKERDRHFTRDIAYNAQIRANQWAAGMTGEVSPEKQIQIEALTKEQNEELDALKAFFSQIEALYAEKIRRDNLSQAGKDATTFIANETQLRVAQKGFAAATEALEEATKAIRPVLDVEELEVANLDVVLTDIEEADKAVNSAKSKLNRAKIKLNQHLRDLDEKRDEMTGEDQEELEELESMKAVLTKLIELSNKFLKEQLEDPADRTVNALMDGKYGNMETAYAKYARNLVNEYKDCAAFVKYEIRQDLKKLNDVDASIKDINESINNMLKDFDSKHKTDLCAVKIEYEKAVEWLATCEGKLEKLKITKTEAEEVAKAAKNHVAAAKAKEKTKIDALNAAQKELDERYALYQQSAIDARAFANAMLRDHRIEKAATEGVPEAAEKMFAELDEEETEETNTAVVTTTMEK